MGAAQVCNARPPPELCDTRSSLFLPGLAPPRARRSWTRANFLGNRGCRDRATLGGNQSARPTDLRDRWGPFKTPLAPAVTAPCLRIQFPRSLQSATWCELVGAVREECHTSRLKLRRGTPGSAAGNTRSCGDYRP